MLGYWCLTAYRTNNPYPNQPTHVLTMANEDLKKCLIGPCNERVCHQEMCEDCYDLFSMCGDCHEWGRNTDFSEARTLVKTMWWEPEALEDRALADRALALSNKASDTDTDTAEIYNNLSRKLNAYAAANATFSYVIAHSSAVDPNIKNDILIAPRFVMDAAMGLLKAKSDLAKFYRDLDPKHEAAVDAVWKL